MHRMIWLNAFDPFKYSVPKPRLSPPMMPCVSGKGAGPLVLLGVVLLALGGWIAFRVIQTITPPAGGFFMPPSAVRVATVKRQPVSDFYETSGSVISDASVTLASEAAGRVSQVLVEEGQTVAQGQVLIRLDGDVARAEYSAAAASARAEAKNIAIQQQQAAATQAALAAAKARESIAQSDLSRFEQLRQDDVISPLEFERKRATLQAQQAESLQAQETLAQAQARVNYQVAQSQAARAQAALAGTHVAKASIIAPFKGTVGQKLLNVGAYVLPGTPAIQLVGAEQLKITVQVPERYLGILNQVQAQIRKAQNGAQNATESDTWQKASIAFINPIVDPQARTALVKLWVPAGSALKPGQFVDVRLALSQRQDALVIPEEAVLSEAGLNQVFVIQPLSQADRTSAQKSAQKPAKAAASKPGMPQPNASVALKPVTLGIRMPGWVEVRQGVNPGDRVVVGGLQKIQDGAQVMILDR